LQQFDWLVFDALAALGDGGDGERLYGGGVLAQCLDLKAWLDVGLLATLYTAPRISH
jgi:hypothetical protein